MGVNLFNVLAGPEVPNATGLIAGARPENRLVGRVPHCRVDGEIVLEGLDRAILECLGVPELDSFIE